MNYVELKIKIRAKYNLYRIFRERLYFLNRLERLYPWPQDLQFKHLLNNLHESFDNLDKAAFLETVKRIERLVYKEQLK